MKTFQSILLVDDDEVSNFLVSRMIQKEGFCKKIFVCKDGYEGVSHLTDSVNNGTFPELILVDLNMPVLGGVEFLEEVKRRKFSLTNTIICIISNVIRDRDKTELESLGAHFFLTKPLTKEKMQIIVFNCR